MRFGILGFVEISLIRLADSVLKFKRKRKFS